MRVKAIFLIFNLMKINGEHHTSIKIKNGPLKSIRIIDQRQLPHRLVWEDLGFVFEVIQAIKDMHLRGAPLIGAVGAFGCYFATLESSKDQFLENFNALCDKIEKARPTAVNLMWAVKNVRCFVTELHDKGTEIKDIQRMAFQKAFEIFGNDIDQCRKIGIHGLKIIEEVAAKKLGETINILTHCNAGWLATCDYGTATSSIYQAHDKGIKVHVWVDETRPRNQGAKLTAWELGQHGIPHTVIADNTGGHLMQHGQVDLCIVGSDRTTRTGDVANKIGTYLKALAAYDNEIPFYVALPSTTFDFELREGKDIPIEIRSENEVKYMDGKSNNEITNVLITPEDSPAINYGFDVTPARLVTSLITERGICEASEAGIIGLFPEQA